MKIQIIGYSGSGKSTLAKELSDIADIPLLHLDSTYYYGDWQERTRDEQTEIVRAFVAANDSWVIDGNYMAVATERFEMSDVTIFLDFPKWRCFWAAYRRSVKYRNKSRPDLPCGEKFDRSFRRWLLVDGRTKERRQQLLDCLNATSGRKVVLQTRREVQQFVKQFASEHGAAQQ